MKFLIVIAGLGILQMGINEITSFFPSPPSHNFSYAHNSVESWDCSKCSHKNSAWTSICGKCGRSK